MLAARRTLRLNVRRGVEDGHRARSSPTPACNVDTRVKVLAIDRQNDFLITLEPTTPLPGAARAGRPRALARVSRRRRASCASPIRRTHSRNDQVIDREVFANLSLDPRHSRYLQSVIGATWVMNNPGDHARRQGRPLRRADRRSQGESVHVRVLDEAVADQGLRSASGRRRYDTMPGGAAAARAAAARPRRRR